MKISSVIMLAAALVGCGASAQTKAAAFTDTAGAVCQIVVQSTDPSLAPLCTDAATVAKAIEALVAESAKQAGTSTAAVSQPTNDQIYAWLVAHGAKAAK